MYLDGERFIFEECIYTNLTFGDVFWGADNITQMIIINMADDYGTVLTQEPTWYFEFGGDQLPRFSTQADISDFFEQVTDTGAVRSGVFAAETDIDLSVLPLAQLIPEPDFSGSVSADRIEGSAEGETLSGRAGADDLTGLAGNDTIRGGKGDDSIEGGTGNDKLLGQRDFDTISGHDGDDIIKGGGQRDLLYGGAGNDFVKGGTGDDYVSGGLGNDRLSGNRDDDFMQGYENNDTLNGGGGEDVLIGGDGDDRLKGGSGRDTFVFYEGDDADVVVDFDAEFDTLSFRYFNESIVYGAQNGQELLDTFAEVTDAGVLFDFGGGNSVLLQNVSDLTGLANAVEIREDYDGGGGGEDFC